MNKTRTIQYSDARPDIRTGDLFLYRPARWNEPLNKLIARGGPIDQLEDWQRYAHAGMAVWNEGVLQLVDVVQWIGGRHIKLSREVSRYPGQYDVYRVQNLRHIHVAANVMVGLAGSPYGWSSLAYAAASQAGILPPIADDDLNGWAPQCAQAVSRALRTAGCDPLKGLADRCTTPNHLAVPGFSKYQMTLGKDSCDQ